MPISTTQGSVGVARQHYAQVSVVLFDPKKTV